MTSSRFVWYPFSRSKWSSLTSEFILSLMHPNDYTFRWRDWFADFLRSGVNWLFCERSPRHLYEDLIIYILIIRNNSKYAAFIIWLGNCSWSSRALFRHKQSAKSPWVSVRICYSVFFPLMTQIDDESECDGISVLDNVNSSMNDPWGICLRKRFFLLYCVDFYRSLAYWFF